MADLLKGTAADAADRIDQLAAENEKLRAAAEDALSGWRYIRRHHGDLYGVGWDRVENALIAALARGEAR